jgi:hypothetical protein
MTIADAFIQNCGLDLGISSHARSRNHVRFQIVIFLQNSLENLRLEQLAGSLGVDLYVLTSLCPELHSHDLGVGCLGNERPHHFCQMHEGFHVHLCGLGDVRDVQNSHELHMQVHIRA